MPAKFITRDKFASALTEGVQPEGMLQRGQNGMAETVSEETRTIRFVFSDNGVDLMQDDIRQEGWELSTFVGGNPVALFAHDSSSLPIGRASSVHVRDRKQLVGDITFASKDVYRFADTVYRLIKGKFLNAVSVGFTPLEYEFVNSKERPGGISFKRQILNEISVVPVPANPRALVEARGMGIDLEPLQEWAEDVIKNMDLTVIDRKRMGEILNIPAEFRSIAKKIPDAAKGARGQLLRCANLAEKIIGAPVAEPAAKPNIETPPVEEVKTTPRLDMARRRLSLIGA